jgi:anaerobic selenocysteine-containing dehydrogenase
MNMQKNTVGSNDGTIVKTTCKMCPISCGIQLHIKDGKIIKFSNMEEHIMPRLCVKAEGIMDFVYSKARITGPLRRVDGELRELSWDEALGVVASELKRIKERYGAKALVLHLGSPFIGTHVEKVAHRFIDLYDTPNYTSGSSFCFYSRVIGHKLTLGQLASADFKSQCIVLWASDPTESAHLAADAISSAKEAGAKLIVIDPRVTYLAKKADIFAQIRPGTDCALALGLLNVIITERLYNKPFVEQWTVGFDRLAEHVERYTPEAVEKITWVPAELIRNLARVYANSKPATINTGIPLDHCTNGIQTHRAIAILVAITGNLDVRGGNMFSQRLRQTDLRMKAEFPAEETIGAEYPLFGRLVHESTVMPILDAINIGKPYPVKALIVQGSNPALTWPNSNKVKNALQKLELLVVIDPFLTDTARLAHIVLPNCTFVESQELRDYSGGGPLPLILMRKKAIEPVVNCMEDWKIWAELGRRMGYGDYFPWKDAEDLFKYLLEPTNVSVEELKERPSGVFFARRKEKKYLEEGLNTPSGKVEIYSEMMGRHGYDPLPTYEEPAESPLSKPHLVEKYPLILITGVRVKMFTHSQWRNLPSLRKYMPQPLVEINLKTAKDLGIADGDLVTVESLRGSIRLNAKVTEDIHPMVVSIQHGWSEANANILTDDEARDPVSAYPGFRSVLCRVAKVEK